jgi:hypothetical protein
MSLRHDATIHQVAGEGYVQIWRATANILNRPKQSRISDKEWAPSLTREWVCHLSGSVRSYVICQYLHYLQVKLMNWHMYNMYKYC